jgi:integrase
MPRALDKLTAVGVKALAKPGRYADGGNLYVRVEKGGSKSWVFIYRWKQPGVAGTGKLKEMGLGSTLNVSLKRAREKAAEYRALLGDEKNPMEVRQALREIPTFGVVADEYLAAQTFKSAMSEGRIKRALEVHALSLREVRVDRIGVDDILAVLKPIWGGETGQKTRGYIEGVLDAAKAKRFRSGDNPAAWKGHLDHLLPALAKGGHHDVLHYEKVPAFIAEVRKLQDTSTAALALEFLILTATRASEVRQATWDEVDLDAKTWTIPAARMKMAEAHVVPLTPRMIEVLATATKRKTKGDYVFPGLEPGKPLGHTAFDKLYARIKVTGFTTHGFRSSFRDWAGDMTEFPREVAEAALAHAVGSQVERAYRRGSALEKRRLLMAAWSNYCGGKPVAT